jgi:hypothetical protein
MNAKVRWLGVLLLVWAAAAPGQILLEPELGDRLINLPTHLTLSVDTLQLLFTHRFSQTTSSGGSGNLYGLDSAADIGIGLELGLSNRVQAEVYRTTFYKEYESALKWTVVRQGADFPIGLALRFGGDYRSAIGVTDRWAGFAQAVLAWRAGHWLDIFAVPMFATNTPTLRNASNVGLGASVHLPHAWDVALEYIPANGDARGANAAWAVGFNKRITGHAFLIYFGNSRATTTDLLVGSDIPGGFAKGDVRLGFNLIRRFPE